MVRLDDSQTTISPPITGVGSSDPDALWTDISCFIDRDNDNQIAFSQVGLLQDAFRIVRFKYLVSSGTLEYLPEIDYGADVGSQAIAINYEKANDRLIVHKADSTIRLISLVDITL
jgi:hypothetical protein